MALGKANTTKRLTTAAATTNGTAVSSIPCDLYSIIATNTSAAVKFLKLYNKSSAPTVGTDTPVLTICLPAGILTQISLAAGMYFNIGLAYAITGADGDSDTTALVAGDVKGLNLIYA